MLMDLHLDTRLQSGHTTTVDALWSGLPVIVWPARSMVSRAASGIASAAGLQWAVARTESEYVQLACALLSQKQRTNSAGARNKVAQARPGMPLFNFESWVSRWETALTLAVRAAAAADWHGVGGVAGEGESSDTQKDAGHIGAPHIVSFSQASTTVYAHDDTSATQPFSASAFTATSSPSSSS
jgi:hypothetical protein